MGEGIQSGFSTGLALGLHALALKQQHEEQIQRFQLAQQVANDHAQYNNASLNERARYHADSLNQKDNALAQKASDAKSQAEGDTALYGQTIAPKAGADYMAGDHSDESFFDTADTLNQQTDAFKQADPATRRAVLSNELHLSRAQDTIRQHDEARRGFATEIYNRKLRTIEASGWPEAVKQKKRAEAAGVHMSATEGMGMNEDEYRASPAFHALDTNPEAQGAAIDYLKRTGQPPDPKMFAPKQPPLTQDPDFLDAENTIKQTGDEVAQRHAIAGKAASQLNAWERAHDPEKFPAPTPPKKKQGGWMSDPTPDKSDPKYLADKADYDKEMKRGDELRRASKKAQDDLNKSLDKHTQAFHNKSTVIQGRKPGAQPRNSAQPQSPGQPAPSPAPQAIDHDAAARQAVQELGPGANREALIRRTNEILTIDATNYEPNPMDDQR